MLLHSSLRAFSWCAVVWVVRGLYVSLDIIMWACKHVQLPNCNQQHIWIIIPACMTSFLLFKSDKQLTNSVTDEWWFVLFELKSSEKVQSSEMETAAMTTMFFHFIIISFPDAVHMIQDPPPSSHWRSYVCLYILVSQVLLIHTLLCNTV